MKKGRLKFSDDLFGFTEIGIANPPSPNNSRSH